MLRLKTATENEPLIPLARIEQFRSIALTNRATDANCRALSNNSTSNFSINLPVLLLVDFFNETTNSDTELQTKSNNEKRRHFEFIMCRQTDPVDYSRESIHDSCSATKNDKISSTPLFFLTLHILRVTESLFLYHINHLIDKGM